MIGSCTARPGVDVLSEHLPISGIGLLPVIWASGIYPENEDSFTNSDVYPEPGGEYSTYGWHRLYKYGEHYIIDNQYGSDGFPGDVEWTACPGDGRLGSEVAHHTADDYGEVNLTPVNCISLYW